MTLNSTTTTNVFSLCDDDDDDDCCIRLWNAFASANGGWIVFLSLDTELVYTSRQLKMSNMPWSI